MKTTKLVVAVAISLFSIGSLMAQDHDHSKMDHSKMEKQNKVTYTCSMHPKVTSDKPGDCPKCGMKLVEKKMDKKMSKAYACSMKCEGDKTYAKAGDCPKCGMKLVEKKMDMKKKDSHKGHSH
jgi:ssDNA-binding Zn-finger/Zn-ribbon topoisomerase 1